MIVTGVVPPGVKFRLARPTVAVVNGQGNNRRAASDDVADSCPSSDERIVRSSLDLKRVGGNRGDCSIVHQSILTAVAALVNQTLSSVGGIVWARVLSSSPRCSRSAHRTDIS